MPQSTLAPAVAKSAHTQVVSLALIAPPATATYTALADRWPFEETRSIVHDPAVKSPAVVELYSSPSASNVNDPPLSAELWSPDVGATSIVTISVSTISATTLRYSSRSTRAQYSSSPATSVGEQASADASTSTGPGSTVMLTSVSVSGNSL